MAALNVSDTLHGSVDTVLSMDFYAYMTLVAALSSCGAADEITHANGSDDGAGAECRADQHTTQQGGSAAAIRKTAVLSTPGQWWESALHTHL